MVEAIVLASKEGIDWFVLELMLELGMADEAVALGKASIALGLEKPHLHSDWWDVFKRLQRCCDLDEFAEPLRRMLIANPSVWGASALARLGRRNEAVAILIKWSVNQNREHALDAVRGLAKLGDRNRAIRTAYQLAKTPKVSPETRIRAARTLGDIDEHRWSVRALEVLDELEFRAIPRAMIDNLLQDPEADDYWIGDFLLRVGRKADALAALEKAIETCPDSYEAQISYRLADLRAAGLLTALENKPRVEEVRSAAEQPGTAVEPNIG